MGEGPLAKGYSRAAILYQVEQSLRRMGTDYLDLYFLHRFDDQVPIEDALRTLDDLVRQGKIRYPAVSNFAAWQIAKALGDSARLGLAAFRCVQPMYSLLKRQAEVELLPMAQTDPTTRGVILVVDDDPAIRALLREYLPGWKVVEAADGGGAARPELQPLEDAAALVAVTLFACLRRPILPPPLQ